VFFFEPSYFSCAETPPATIAARTKNRISLFIQKLLCGFYAQPAYFKVPYETLIAGSLCLDLGFT
jgi:hypothetical protein